MDIKEIVIERISKMIEIKNIEKVKMKIEI